MKILSIFFLSSFFILNSQILLDFKHSQDLNSEKSFLDNLDSQTLQAMQNAIDLALSKKLYERKEWLDLLHYSSLARQSQKKSEIDSEDFFYARDKKGGLGKNSGKKNAKNEMIATIMAFYQKVDDVFVPQHFKDLVSQSNALLDASVTALPRRSFSQENYHAICRYPARFGFLDSELHFANLQNLKCDEFHAMRKYVNPKSASLIFPSAYVSSPASMFGHTFLLLNSAYNSRLLSFAINYQASANPDTENGVLFALKGLVGGYDGRFSILPYYEKIKEYRDTENRDIWEFDLNLTPEEVARMYAHIWELGDSWSYYYFFDENCSYNILWLLEVARPSLNLRKNFVYQVNPPETIFVLQKNGLIVAEHYRPSKRTKLFAYEKFMNSSDVKLAKKIAKGKASAFSVLDSENLSTQEKQFILESANEMTEYYGAKGKLDDEIYTSIIHDLGTTRSKLGKSFEPPIHEPYSPLSASRGLRISPFYFAHLDSENANSQGAGLEFRMAYHDITDNERGYLQGAQIEFMKISGYGALNSDSKNVHFRIHEAKILNLASFAKRSNFFKPFSYRLDTGFSRRFLDYENLNFYANASVGVSYFFGTPKHFNGYVFYMLEPLFFAQGGANFMLANAFGASLNNGENLQFNFEYKLKAFESRVFGNAFDVVISYNLLQNLALFAKLESDLLPKPYTTSSNMSAGLRAYF